MRISERLRLICEHNHWKIKDFSELTGLPYRTIQGYIGGEREPNAEGMTAIAKVGVNLNWLVSGEGEMFKGTEQQADLNQAEIELLQAEIELLNQYRAMSNELQKAIEVSFKAINTELK
ncbi:transcriptional regulator [[Haemophilus] ducreyi]|uniref:helix-turn-helix domain-containing protein n=1 Tax=Haemophilus ducreyi TaxID=730 RepID=UPI0007CDE671|nr:helix-turn-helix transcriptional regulator [[Haemophilus] ducreyi]ANF73656.1 transcriptional regulator [[Haemophilus] ducreyi]ANF75507.1 transcriptional regulator [[Haemophilus] ducreyi]